MNNILLSSNNAYKYEIYFQDKLVCNINRKTGEVTNLNEGIMPFGLYLEESDDFDTRLNNIENFNHWCSTRVLTMDRKYAKEILNHYGLKQAISDRDRADISLAAKGLTLTDSYWIRPFGTDFTWDGINLFENSLSNSMVDISLSGTPTISSEELITPDLSTGGVFPKTWWRLPEDGKFLLYKGDVNDSVTKETEASQILKDLGIPTLLYTKRELKNTTVSICDCMTNKDLCIAPAIDIFIWCMNQDMNFNSLLVSQKQQYDFMNLADYLVGNTDRHQENWGFYYSAPDRKIIGLYPLMDFNHAFEATEQTMCLPEKMLGQTKTQEEIAYEIYCRYEEQLNFDVNLDKYKYGNYVQERINHLIERYREEYLPSR